MLPSLFSRLLSSQSTTSNLPSRSSYVSTLLSITTRFSQDLLGGFFQSLHRHLLHSPSFPLLCFNTQKRRRRTTRGCGICTMFGVKSIAASIQLINCFTTLGFLEGVLEQAISNDQYRTHTSYNLDLNTLDRTLLPVSGIRILSLRTSYSKWMAWRIMVEGFLKIQLDISAHNRSISISYHIECYQCDLLDCGNEYSKTEHISRTMVIFE